MSEMPQDTTEAQIAIDELLRCAINDLDTRRKQDPARVSVVRGDVELQRMIEEDLFEVGDLLERPVFAACRRATRNRLQHRGERR